MSVDILMRNLNFIYCEPHFETEESSRWEFGVPLPEINEGETQFLYENPTERILPITFKRLYLIIAIYNVYMVYIHFTYFFHNDLFSTKHANR